MHKGKNYPPTHKFWACICWNNIVCLKSIIILFNFLNCTHKFIWLFDKLNNHLFCYKFKQIIFTCRKQKYKLYVFFSGFYQNVMSIFEKIAEINRGLAENYNFIFQILYILYYLILVSASISLSSWLFNNIKFTNLKLVLKIFQQIG